MRGANGSPGRQWPLHAHCISGVLTAHSYVLRGRCVGAQQVTCRTGQVRSLLVSGALAICSKYRIDSCKPLDDLVMRPHHNFCGFNSARRIAAQNRPWSPRAGISPSLRVPRRQASTRLTRHRPTVTATTLRVGVDIRSAVRRVTHRLAPAGT